MMARQPVPFGPAILFCPADRPDRYGKALAAADAIILDLEDAVLPERKEEARAAVRNALSGLPPDRTVVRINSLRLDEGQRDLAMLRTTQLRFVLLPKAESGAEVEALVGLSVIALCETALGVQRAYEIGSAPGCIALMWGGEDLTADIGGQRSRGRNGTYLPHVQYARAHVLISAAAAGKKAWDGVYLDIADHEGLAEECQDAVSMGFAAKVAIHPSHAAIIRATYRPSDQQLEWAQRLLRTVRGTSAGVMQFEGKMIDGPLVTMAENIVAARVTE